MYDCVVFDLDGTLLYTLPDIAAACNHSLRALGFAPHPVSAYSKMVGNGVDNLVLQMLPSTQRGEFTRKLAKNLFSSYYSQHMTNLTEPYSGITSLLEKLNIAEVKIAVLSNKPDALTCDIIEKFFPQTFSIVRGQCDAFPLKPDPTSLLDILQLMGTDKDSALYVGDSDADMQTAAAANIASCGVSWGFRGVPELLDNGAHYIANTADDILSLVLQDDN